jgi:hypothetical protein
MAGRILNRRKLRKQADRAEEPEVVVSDPASAVAPSERAAKRKSAAPPRARKPRKSKTPPRMRACWGVFDGGMKEVAIFDYNHRAAAEEKLAALLGKQKGVYFLQIVKQPMPDMAPAGAPSVG